MISWLKTRSFREQVWSGLACILLGMFLAWITKINYIANLGCACHALVMLMFPKMPNRTRLTEKEEKIIRLVSLLALILFLFVFQFDLS